MFGGFDERCPHDLAAWQEQLEQTGEEYLADQVAVLAHKQRLIGAQIGNLQIVQGIDKAIAHLEGRGVRRKFIRGLPRKQVEAEVMDVGQKQRSATAVISTRSSDRMNDVMESRGCDLTHYSKNPTVLALHNQEDKYPVGKARNPLTRELAVTVEANRIISTCFFSKHAEAQQVFELVRDEVLIGASVGFNPLEWERLGEDGCHYTKWELLEWSWVSVPANGECVLVSWEER